MGDAVHRGPHPLSEAFYASRLVPAMLGGWIEPLPRDGHSVGLPGRSVT